ncbi:putative secreted protein [Sorangium cellulosum So ce56]|uniref:Secreted protein n=1 Tax=Sorangium cellulosum (strain So ce56) TaxID=448385 RepID=A9GQ10_SORC5|nr:hypothetical protein [Sorangium cellulosum]CAN96831.1 putative secreted protein [Sorangium cellulosum So ce56]
MRFPRTIAGCAVASWMSLSTTSALAEVVLDQIQFFGRTTWRKDDKSAISDFNNIQVSIAAIPYEDVYSVEAEYAGVTTPLTFNDYNDRYYATIDTSAVPYGPHTLTFTAYDKLGRASTRQYTVHKYAPPSVWVASPRPNRTLTGDTRIAATCVGTPPYSCTQLKARVRSQVRDEVLVGVPSSVPGRMDVLHSLSSPLQSGEVLTIRLEATDDVGPIWYGPTLGGGLGFHDWALPRVYVERSPKLTAVQRAPGAILDFDATRVLFIDHALQIGVVDRMTQQVTWLGELRMHHDWMHKPGYGALTPSGVAMQAWYGYVFLWKDGALDRTPRQGRLDAVNGDTLLWTRADDDEAIVHTFSTGTETSLWLDPGSASPFQADITASGDAYYSTHEEPWIRGPGEIRLGNHPGYLQRPITDGTNVAGRWWNGSVSSSYLYTAGGAEVFLGDSRTGDAAGLLLHAGYAAYLKSDGAVNQVWLRTPSGDEHQLSDFATPSQFDQQELRIGHDGISDTGEVMFLNDKKRYIGRPGAAPEEISSDLGHGRWFDGDWYVTLGDTLFKVASAEAPAFLAALPGDAALVNACLQGDRAAMSASPDLTNERHRTFASGKTRGKPEG